MNDKGLISDSLIGGASINLRFYFENPGEWFSEYVELKDKKGDVGNGYVYLQLQWRSEGEDA